MPFPAFRVARAIAVFRFPLVFMIFTMVSTLEFRSEECTHCTERYKCRVIQPVHVCVFEDFHLFSDKFYRNTDITFDALHGIDTTGAFIRDHPTDSALHKMVGSAGGERSPAVTAGTAFHLVPVIGKNTGTTSGDDGFLCVDDRNLFSRKPALCN